MSRTQLKGTLSGDGYLLSWNILIRTFCVCADGFQGLSKAFHFLYNLFASLELLINSKNNFAKKSKEE